MGGKTYRPRSNNSKNVYYKIIIKNTSDETEKSTKELHRFITSKQLDIVHNNYFCFITTMQGAQ